MLPFGTKWGKGIMYMHGDKYLDFPGSVQKKIVIHNVASGKNRDGERKGVASHRIQSSTV